MSLNSPQQTPLIEVDTAFGSRKFKPVKWFAVIGVICILIQIYPFSRWILSGPRPTETGADPVPHWMVVNAYVMQGTGVLMGIATAYYLVWRPWRREGRLSLYGIAFFAILTAFWLDTAANYWNHVYVINPVLLNYGSWNNFMPFWGSPNAEHIAEPFLLFLPMYGYAILLPTVGFCALMRYIRSRRPGISNFRLVGVVYVLAFVLMFILDGFIYVRTGLYAMVGTIPSLTLFQGEWYQYPMYHAVICCFLYWVAPSAIWFIRNDHGETLIERGLSSMKVTPRQSQWVRFFALAGMYNILQFTYMLSAAIISVMPTFTWAHEIVDNRSYLRNELCGEGTSYACPNGDIPIPRIGGIHVGPDGELVVPEGTNAP